MRTPGLFGPLKYFDHAHSDSHQAMYFSSISTIFVSLVISYMQFIQFPDVLQYISVTYTWYYYKVSNISFCLRNDEIKEIGKTYFIPITTKCACISCTHNHSSIYIDCIHAVVVLTFLGISVLKWKNIYKTKIKRDLKYRNI